MTKLENLLPSEPSWLKHNTILLGKVGSHAYGTATETSDLDYKGIVIPPVNYFLGLNSFDGYDKSGGKNYKNTSEDVDVTLLHINKFVKDAMAGVPNNLELLFLNENDYIYLNDFGKDLIDIRHKFLSKQIMKKFGGYAKSQANKLKQLQSNGKARADLLYSYGYDAKFYTHTIRLLEMAIEILKDGDFTTKRPNADYLIQLRNGIHTLDEALVNIEKLEKELSIAYENSLIQETPDFDFINSFLVDFNVRYLNL